MQYDIELGDLQERPTAVVRGHVATDGIPDFLGPAFGEVMGAVAHQHLQVAGAPFACYVASEDRGWDIEAGFPVSAPVAPEGRVEAADLPGGRTARTLHVGAYDKIAEAYDAVRDWLTDNGYVPTGSPWESYLDGPEVPEPRTELFVPCEEAHPLHR